MNTKVITDIQSLEIINPHEFNVPSSCESNFILDGTKYY